MDFSLDQLLVLDAIERTGSFATAAKELGRVPSAISYSVKGLEEGLGVELFDRSRRKATFTPAGRRIVEAAAAVLEPASALEAVAAELAGGWEPELRVIVDGILPMAPMIHCLQRFSQADVPTRLRVEVEYQEGVVDRFDRDKAHVMLCIGFDADEDTSSYDLWPLSPLDLALVAAPAHPEVELIVRDSSRQFANGPKRSFSGSKNVVYLSDFHTKRLALLDGVGFGWMPRHLIAEDLRAGSIVLVQKDGWTYHPQVAARHGVPRGRAVRTLLKTLVPFIKNADD